MRIKGGGNYWIKNILISSQKIQFWMKTLTTSLLKTKKITCNKNPKKVKSLITKIVFHSQKK